MVSIDQKDAKPACLFAAAVAATEPSARGWASLSGLLAFPPASFRAVEVYSMTCCTGPCAECRSLLPLFFRVAFCRSPGRLINQEPTLQNQSVTYCRFRNPFVLIFIQNARGCTPPLETKASLLHHTHERLVRRQSWLIGWMEKWWQLPEGARASGWQSRSASLRKAQTWRFAIAPTKREPKK